MTSDHGAILSVDGQEDVPVTSGATLMTRNSEHVTRLVRFKIYALRSKNRATAAERERT